MTSVRFAVILSLFGAAITGRLAIAQTTKAPDVNRFMGNWSGDRTLNRPAEQSGLFPPGDTGLKVSTTADSLVVTTTYGATYESSLTYKLDGSTLPATLNGRAARTKLAKDGEALVLDVFEGTSVTRLQSMTMSVDGD